VENYTSGRLSSVKGIDGFIMIPGGTRTVETGAVVDVEWI
jgi:molybdopterin biosynthesis enzyme